MCSGVVVVVVVVCVLGAMVVVVVLCATRCSAGRCALHSQSKTALSTNPNQQPQTLNQTPKPNQQDKRHLYFLFDLLPGGDLMDVLVAEARVVRRRVPARPWRVGCMAPQVRMLRGMPEALARFYAASVVQVRGGVAV